MAFKLEMSLEGEKQLSRILLIAADGVTDFRTPLEESRDILLKRIDDNYASRGRLFKGWAPRKREYPWPLLEKTGKMRKRFRGEVTSTELAVTNTREWFKYHQSNKPRKSNLPRRIMLMIDPVAATDITKAFQSYLVGLLRGSK